MFSSSKQRTTCTTVSVSRIFARNWFPSPSPFDAPRTSPAMSRNSTVAGTIFCRSETPHHLHDGIRLPDIRQKLVPEPFPFRRTANEPRNVEKLDRRGHDLLPI